MAKSTVCLSTVVEKLINKLNPPVRSVDTGI